MVKQCFLTFWVDREGRARIIKVHNENATLKACNEYGSPHGPFMF